MGIKLKNDRLHWDGKPIDVVASRELVEAIQKLPIHSTDPGELTVQVMFRNLTPGSVASIRAYKDVNVDFEVYLDQLEDDYAAVAHPDTGVWDDDLFGADNVLDSVFVDCPPVARIITLLDGRRMVVYRDASGIRYMTFVEFEDHTGTTVRSFLQRTAVVKVKRLQKALEIVNQDKPKKFDVAVCDANGAMKTEQMLAYTKDQITSYLNEHKKVVVYVDESNS